VFRNYLKVAIRNLVRQKLYSTIIVFGLAVGITSCLLIFLYVRHERSFDRFHANAARLYRAVITEDPPEREPFTYVEAPYPLAGALKEGLPGIEDAVRIHVRNIVAQRGEQAFPERCHLVDPGFFRAFSFPLLKGDPDGVLRDPKSAVLTESAARRLFGSEDPVGRELTLRVGERPLDFTVAGIAADPPANSSIRFGLVIPFENVREYLNPRVFTQWLNVYFETYVLLDRPRAATETDPILASLVRKSYPQDYAAYVTVHLQPLTDIHLDPSVPAGFEPTGHPLYALVLTIIAVLIMAVACVNFTTLAVGRSARRAREVGVRKTVGADRRRIVSQFLGEALLLTFSALGLGLLMTTLVLPLFGSLTGTALVLAVSPATIVFLIALMAAVALAAGSYPAFVLARLEPVDVIGRAPKIGGRGRLVGGLVIGQFAASIGLIVCTLVMNVQFRYLLGRDLGFDKEQVVVIPNRNPSAGRAPAVERVRNALAGRREITGVSGASTAFSGDWTLLGFNTADGVFRQFAATAVDHDFLATMRLSLVEGRWFSREFGTDPAEALVVNESLVRYFGWTSGVGRSLPGPDFPPHRIIGVVRDFNFESLKNEVRPAVMVLDPSTVLRGINDISQSFPIRTPNFLFVRIAPGLLREGIAAMKGAWAQASPGIPDDFTFLDDDIRKQYSEVERWRKVVGFASVFTIVIAALGLVGLTALTVARRRKEIGVRKVLGASPGRILLLFSTDFGKLVLAANLVAWPVAYMAMRRWLQDFAYRAGIPAWSFILAGVAALVIALGTISWQAIRAARTDPVETIRYE
jgi:putative ABC transport system permease protein